MEKVILASQSPRRRELLAQIGLEFQVEPSEVEEVISRTDPAQVVRELSLQKAADVAGRQIPGTDGTLVIGADTIVVYQREILGKPHSRQEASQMLRKLQGNTHSVYTGVSLIFLQGDRREEITFAEETRVSMYPMDDEEIQWYLATGEPMDKAGAYGIQGYGARFIREVSGDYNTVVGLPVGRIYQEIKKRGIQYLKKGDDTVELYGL